MSDAPNIPPERPIKLHRLVRPMVKQVILAARETWETGAPRISDEEAEYLIRALGVGED